MNAQGERIIKLATELALTRNALSNLYWAIKKADANEHTTATEANANLQNVDFAMHEAKKVLGE